MKAMLAHAYANGYAVGGFDVIDLAFVDGVMAAAERCRAPVILSLAESHFAHYDLETLMPAVEAAARRASVPVAIHLDHGASVDSAVHAIRLGCNGVMVDASEHSLEENIQRTAEVVRMAHGCGVPVEGEIGYVPGEEGESAALHPGAIAYTEVEDAARYVDQTGVDLLAVSIGTVHGRFRGRPELDLERLAAINARLGIPLVIHGGTGLDDAQFRALIERGVSKINYYTALADAAWQAVGAADQYPRLFQRVSDAVAAEAARCIDLWGSAGRADEVLAACPSWTAVEHLITYNVSPDHMERAGEMIDEGRRILAAIPGVRAVEAGEAVAPDRARYRHGWLVRFTHPAVIDSYREHPAHVAYADTLFRPAAADRLSIDFHLRPEDPRDA